MRVLREQTVYQLTFLPRFFPVNCYLVEEDDGLTLIDAALPYSTKGILLAARQIGKPITRIVLTHAHGDHVGALDSLKQTLPNVPVYISRRDARLMEGDQSLDPDEAQTPIRGDVPKSLKTRADVLLEDGDRVGSLLAIAAPGHTPGHMAYLDTRNRAMIAGDAFQERGGFAIAGQFRARFPFPAFGTWSKQTAVESARKLKDFQPSLLALGHGRFVRDPEAAITRVLAEADRKQPVQSL